MLAGQAVICCHSVLYDAGVDKTGSDMLSDVSSAWKCSCGLSQC